MDPALIIETAAPPSAIPRRALAVKFALCALALVPIAIAVVQLGRIHPDEVYQYLEPAWFRVHGYGVLAWEWKVGLRNWAAPILLGWMLRLAGVLGLNDPRAYRVVVALPQLVLHAAALFAVFRFARRRTSETGALLAALAFALAMPVLLFAGRTLGESFSGDLLVLAAEAIDRDEPRAAAVGGVWLGLSVVARYGSAVFVLVALVWLAARRRWRALGFCVLAGVAVALGLGALDWATWGRPFHSLLAYLQFNVFSGGAARSFGRQPGDFYFWPLVRWAPFWIWPALVLAFRKERAPLASVMALVYLAAISLTPHKEERFLYPAIALLLLDAGPAAAAAVLASRRALALVAVLCVLALDLWPFHYAPELRGDQLRALVQAGRGAHGVLIVNEGLWGAGGFFYLGAQIPWVTCDFARDYNFQRAIRDRRFDRAITFEGRALDALAAAGFRRVGQVGRETILARP